VLREPGNERSNDVVAARHPREARRKTVREPL
jgi:hypothetical protein